MFDSLGTPMFVRRMCSHYTCTVFAHCTVEYNDFNNLALLRPLMVAKYSKTHLLNMFFVFKKHFVRVWLKNLQKVLKWSKTIVLYAKMQDGIKNAEFYADCGSVEKVWKMLIGYYQKSDRKIEFFLNFITVGKSFRPKTTFAWIFLHLFQRIRTRHQILRLMIPI